MATAHISETTLAKKFHLCSSPLPLAMYMKFDKNRNTFWISSINGLKQAWPKSGPRAKSGPQSNFVRPAAWFEIMKWIQPVVVLRPKTLYTHICLYNAYGRNPIIDATQLKKKRKKKELQPKTLYHICLYNVYGCNSFFFLFFLSCVATKDII